MTLTNFNATTPQLKAVKNILDAYLTLDIKNVESFTSKDFKFETYPKMAALSDAAKEQFFQRYGTIFSMLTKVDVNVHEVIEAPGKVVLHLTATSHTADGQKLDYDSLSVLTLIEENGELKIADIKDFSDPEKRGNIHGWAAKALAKRAT